MKWALIVALAVMVVIVSVVYLSRNARVVVPPAPALEISKPRPPLQNIPRKKRANSPVDITGPLKDRKLLHWVLPKYPEWAEYQGVVGVSQFKVRVTPAGLVMANLEPQLMNSDLRLDDEASEAIRQWRFEEKPNAFGDQWGIVTIRYSLLQGPEADSAILSGVPMGSPPTTGAWECVKQWLGGAKNQFVYICKLRPAVEQK